MSPRKLVLNPRNALSCFQPELRPFQLRSVCAGKVPNCAAPASPKRRRENASAAIASCAFATLRGLFSKIVKYIREKGSSGDALSVVTALTPPNHECGLCPLTLAPSQLLSNRAEHAWGTP